MTNPLFKQQSSRQQTTTINLPRGNLDLTYQTTSDYQLDDLLGFAQRINPKRAFLFVSKVLGRHIPVAPSSMRNAFSNLAQLIPDDLPQPILVIGMAETAVGLSAGVHQALQTRYPQALLLNSTRHAQINSTLFTSFSEDHSHASRHLIYQSGDADVQQQLVASKTVIMVDDEASTGNTCVNVVSALRDAGLEQIKQVHLTTLVDWSLGQKTQEGNDATDTDHISSRLKGIEFQRHHLLAGAWQWTEAPNPQPINMPSVDTTEAGSYPVLPTDNWGRQPTQDSTQGFADYLAQFKQAYCEHFAINNGDGKKNNNINNQKDSNKDSDKDGHCDNWQTHLPAKQGKRLLVLGSNEFVWLPFLLAEWLEKQTVDTNSIVKFSALTRSPIALGGAINAVLSFQDNYGLGMTNFVYNVEPAQWDLIVLCLETPGHSVDKRWLDLDNVMVVSPKSCSNL